MSEPGEPEKAAEKAARQELAKAELAQIELTDEEITDNIGTVMLSVVRDMAASSCYGKTWHDTGAIPAPEDVFSPRFADHVMQQLGALGPVHHFHFPLYGNTGDALGLLSRVLICCRDIDQLKPLVGAANAQIEKTGARLEHMLDSEYVRHLRNAVLHTHFKVFVNHEDPFDSEFVFIDIDPARQLTAKITLTNNQLVEVLRIVVHEVFEAYLANLPNGRKWIVAP